MKSTEVSRVTNEHVRKLLSRIEADGDMTHSIRGHVMTILHQLALELTAKEAQNEEK